MRATWLVCALSFGCGGEPPGAADTRRAVEVHLDDFAAYDRWARRLGLADSAFRSEAALAEAAFAPLRQEEDVIAAWLIREGPDARSLRSPDGAPPPPGSGWVTIQTEGLGALDAQRAPIGDERATFIRRSRPTQGDATLHVIVAYRPRSSR
ncbi:MAG: hypothetical protein VYE22_21150 [Myxococcota bacterium]|nr:hypothetical protein [Myxococcota bacterium]